MCSYQDICFFFKFLLNPTINSPEATRRSRLSAKLVWQYRDATGYNVRAFDITLTCVPPRATDKNDQPVPPPVHRFPSTATPSFYLTAPLVRSEDDVVYRPQMPGFNELEGVAGAADEAAKELPVLTQQDSELLIS